MDTRFLATVLACTVVTGCMRDSVQQNNNGRTAQVPPAGLIEPVESTPLASATGSAAGFTLLDPQQSGIDFSNVITDRLVILSTFSTVSGVASADFDDDGDIDVFLVGVEEASRLFRNDGLMIFTDVTAEMPCDISNNGGLGASALFFDVEPDGDLDLYVGYKNRANSLFINEGGQFVRDEAQERGVANEFATASAAVFDADNDGDLDMYIASHLDFPHDRGILRGLYGTGDRNDDIIISPEHRDKFYKTKYGDTMMKPDPDQFLLNDGSGHFMDATEASGMDVISWSMQPLAVDINNDGWTDLYLTSDLETPDSLFINNQDGTFTDRSAELLLKSPYFSMGADMGDINNDGLPDLYAGDMLSREKGRAKRQSGDMKEFRTLLVKEETQPVMRNMLWLNRGGGHFTEMAEYAGVKAAEWTWSSRFADLDCDGWEDLVVANGFIRDAADVDEMNTVRRMAALHAPAEEIEGITLAQPILKSTNYVFQRKAPGSLQFAMVDGNWGITNETFTPSIALVDFDNDGDLDMLSNNVMDRADLYRNDSPAGNRVVVSLEQGGANPQAWGARLWANVGDMVLTRDLIANRGYATGEPAVACFGLGDASQIDKLEIRWPDGSLQTVDKLAAGMHHMILYQPGLPQWQPVGQPPMFTEEKLDWGRIEADTDRLEFDDEPLLPFMQGYSGGGIGAADLNGDGYTDVYVAGAAGQRGSMLLGNPDGSFTEAEDFMPRNDASVEEMAVLCFDANADGWTDVLVTAGGMEGKDDRDYRDRLMINNEGKGLRVVPLGMDANVSTAAADAADIDGDGDVDLLICGHIAGRSLGTGTRSWILTNDGSGSFSDATATICPQLMQQRLITDAALQDLDGDRLPELVASVSWGPVMVFGNIDGKLVLSQELGGNGWWNSICLADMNADGALEIIAGNIGENTKYHPSEGKPAAMYAGDMDGNGTRDLIEVGYRGNGELIPGRGRSCSGYAIESIPQNFPTWKSFSEASLEDVYGKQIFNTEYFEVTNIANCIFVNDGSGGFSEQHLPVMAQLAPIYGMIAQDFNGDGNMDLFLANNFRWTQPETGRWNIGTQTLLLGDGQFGFEAVDPADSGILIQQDGRGLVCTDFNNDSKPDLLLCCCNSEARILDNDACAGSLLEVSLTGPAANPDAIGSVISVELSSGQLLRHHVTVRSSYLSSYSGSQQLVIPAGETLAGIFVSWPDGSESSTQAITNGRVSLSWGS
ncbi:MAG: VCBS repeat-containing protein [Planctomycetales bacterium]|nr:VCBS repeat-containing protein [bacterium]UNM07584.1 MAG: VCBS repeat-containing protein [Planctomycetales bacterium]